MVQMRGKLPAINASAAELNRMAMRCVGYGIIVRLQLRWMPPNKVSVMFDCNQSNLTEIQRTQHEFEV